MTVLNLDMRRGLEVLERLKQAVAEYARREERMTRGLEVRRSGIAWRYQAATSGSEEGEAAQLAEIESSFGEMEARVRRVAADRQKQVRRASAQELRNLPRKGREARGNWLANLQMRLRQAETMRGEALRAAEIEAGQVAAALTEEMPETRGAETGGPERGGWVCEPAQKNVGARSKRRAARRGWRLVSEALTEAEARLAVFKKFPAPRIFQSARQDVKAGGNGAGGGGGKSGTALRNGAPCWGRRRTRRRSERSRRHTTAHTRISPSNGRAWTRSRRASRRRDGRR
jgi:hypothetical protein